MDTYQALNIAIGRHAVAVAKRLQKSSSLIHKWMEPSTDWTDSGTLNPLDRLADIIETARASGQGDAAYEPIRWLARRFGMICIPSPDPRRGTMNQALAAAIKEFADLAQATVEALNDGTISPREASRITVEGHHALEAIVSLMTIVKETPAP